MTAKHSAHVALLLGGLSSEREVSLVSGKAISKALTTLGYKVTEVDMNKDVGAVLTQLKPDIVFNGLHGTYGEDGCIQGVLEILGIPYTHSGVMASALAMNKPIAKRFFESAGIRCPKGEEYDRETLANLLSTGKDPMPRPYVIKPSAEGSSVGVIIVTRGDNTNHANELLPGCDRFLVESYIPGRELSTAVLDDRALGVLELRPKHGFYDYKSKYTDGMTDHIMPAEVPQAIYDEAMATALKAHKVLGCRGVSRSDFRYDEKKDKLYLLEVNTHPGMTPLSIAPEIAAHQGISFNDLIEYLVTRARCDYAK